MISMAAADTARRPRWRPRRTSETERDSEHGLGPVKSIAVAGTFPGSSKTKKDQSHSSGFNDDGLQVDSKLIQCHSSSLNVGPGNGLR